MRVMPLIGLIVVLVFSACSSGGGKNSSKTVADLIPNQITFTSVTNADLNRDYTSPEQNITSISQAVTGTVTGGVAYVNSIEQNGSTFTLNAGDIIALKVRSSTQYGVSKTAVLQVGTMRALFTVTTSADITVSPFTFTDIVDANFSTTYTSNTITLSGLSDNTAVAASLSSGVLIHNGTVVDRNAEVRNGDTLAIRLTSGNQFGATIEATLNVGTVSDTFSISTHPRVKALIVNPPSWTMTNGQTHLFKASLIPANAKTGVTWKSSDATIASVDSSGLVSGHSTGSATITATADENSSIFQSVIVNVQSIASEANTTAIFYDGILWEVSEPQWYTKVADATQMAIGPGFGDEGNLTLPLVSSSGIGFTSSITMPSRYRFVGQQRKFDVFTFDAAKGESFQVDLYSAQGDPYMLALYGDDNNITEIDKDIFFDNDSGQLKSARLTLYDVPAGEHAILATTPTESGSYDANVVITRITQPKPNALTVSPTTLVLTRGETSKLAAYIQPEGARKDVSWSSLDTTVATVDTNGVVSAVGMGTTRIIATSDINSSVIGSMDIFVDIAAYLTYAGEYDTSGSVMDSVVSQDGTKAYIVDSVDGLKVIDVESNSSNYMKRIGYLSIVSHSEEIELSRDDNVTFLASGDSGVVITRISTPTAPSMIGSYATGYAGQSNKYAWALSITGDEERAFVATEVGVDVLDVSNNAAISLLDEFNMSGGTTYDIVLSSDNKRGFVAHGSAGVKVLNIQYPSTLSQIGSFSTVGSANDLAISKDDATLFVACGNAGLQVIDISNPTSPSSVTIYDTAGFAQGVTLSKDETKLYIADGTMGMLILDITDLNALRVVSAYNSAGDTHEVTLKDENVFLSDGGNGLVLLH